MRNLLDATTASAMKIAGKSATDIVARNEAIAVVDSIALGGFATAGVFASRAIVNGAVRAELDGSVTGSGSVLVQAIGGNLADSRTLSVAVSGLASMGASIQFAQLFKRPDGIAKSILRH